jgi:N-succinyl-L-ornithine transcarbamylase
MRNYLSVHDVHDLDALVQRALYYKNNPMASVQMGYGKTLGLLFFNASLRTRLSTQKAAQNLGMQVMVMNVKEDSWALEMADAVIMDGDKVEHVKEAAAVIGQYCDIIGIRSFASLTDKQKDMEEEVISQFIKHSGVPVLSLESALRHPLQSLADVVTIEEYKTRKRPKVVLTWAPHPKALPQAVPNSFAEWMNVADVDFVITHPEGYELDPQFSGKAPIIYNQDEAFAGADFIYAKNWSSFTHYGQVLSKDTNWTVTQAKMQLTNQARFMHCLPVRRNMIVEDAVLDSASSIVIQQAGNRVFAAQAVLHQLLEDNYKPLAINTQQVSL